MGSPSESEGEIVEKDLEKATTEAQPSTQEHISVNRRLREALSPSPPQSPYHPSPRSPVEPLRSGGVGTTFRKGRSRSPIRREAWTRGEKRRHVDDHHVRGDARRSRLHYERRPSFDNGRRGRGSHDDWHRHGPQDAYLAYDDPDISDQYLARRRVTRSRSPSNAVRFNMGSGRDERGQRIDGRNVLDKADRNKNATDGAHKQKSAQQSRIHEGNSPSRFPVPIDGTESPYQAQHGTSANEKEQLKGSSATDFHVSENSLMEPPIIVDQTLLIEERRKRREAIKAKYIHQATPLLVQALQLGSAPGSPSSLDQTPVARSERSASPSGFSPRTPQHDSGIGPPSPVEVSADSELAKDNRTTATVEDADEPSAADYDPTMDMQEDRVREDQRQVNQGRHTIAYYEMETDNEQLPVPLASPEKAEVGNKTKADDMFASDDEADNMFAPVSTTKTETLVDGALKPPPVPRAKELDMSLLDNWDDPDGYYRIILGELMEGRYHVQASLGKGMFSSVVRAVDTRTEQLVAIKIVRNNESMLKAGTKEMEILQKLANADPEDKKHIVRLERSFMHKGHLCMVFENLSINLREVLKKFGRDVGINLKAVRSYAQQMFLGLSLLRKCNILHADLKPDNILVNEARNMLKVCDLGSAADATEGGNSEITPYLVSRFYRAPEIILGVPYDYAIDTWSVGCTLFELYTGKILFTGRTNNQMLRSIMECRGKFSLKLLKKAEFGAVHFDEANLNFRSVERDRLTGRDVTKLINFVKPTRDLKSRLLASSSSQGRPGVLPDLEMKELNLFTDLLDRCLALNPERRITPAEALRHPFIHRVVPAGKA